MAQNYGTRSGRMVQMSPPWLQGSYGGSWQAGLGDLLDTYLANAKTAVKLSMPSEAASLGDSNALDMLGQTAYISRYYMDTDSEYAERIRNKWTTWGRAGAAPRQDDTGCNILDDLRGIGFGVTLLEYHDWPLISGQFYGAPISADVNGDPWWSQFWLVIDSFRGDDLSSGGEYDAIYYDDSYYGPVLTYNSGDTYIGDLVVGDDYIGGPPEYFWGASAWGETIWTEKEIYSVDYIDEILKVVGLWKPENSVLAGIIFKINKNAAIFGLDEYDSEAEHCSEGDDSEYYYP